MGIDLEMVHRIQMELPDIANSVDKFDFGKKEYYQYLNYFNKN